MRHTGTIESQTSETGEAGRGEKHRGRRGNKACHRAKIGTKMRDGSARIEEGAGGESTRKRLGKGKAQGAPSI